MSIDREFVDRTGRSATWFLGSQGKSVARHILNQANLNKLLTMVFWLWRYRRRRMSPVPDVAQAIW